MGYKKLSHLPHDTYRCVSGAAAPENKVTHWRCHPISKSGHKVPKSVLRAVLGKDAVHPSCDSPNTSRRFALVAKAMSAWLVKTRRAPSRHSRDAGVYGHTTTAMHKLSTPPPRFLAEWVFSTDELHSYPITLEECCFFLCNIVRCILGPCNFLVDFFFLSQMSGFCFLVG